jgi:hypothetical protein
MSLRLCSIAQILKRSSSRTAMGVGRGRMDKSQGTPKMDAAGIIRRFGRVNPLARLGFDLDQLNQGGQRFKFSRYSQTSGGPTRMQISSGFGLTQPFDRRHTSKSTSPVTSLSVEKFLQTPTTSHTFAFRHMMPRREPSKLAVLDLVPVSISLGHCRAGSHLAGKLHLERLAIGKHEPPDGRF